MSTAAERQTWPVGVPRRDPYRYGVRYVRRELSNGEEDYVATPMPREALLHPLDEDYPVEAHAHDEDRTYLKCAIRIRLPRDGVVLSSCRVDWGVVGIEPHAPDISAFDHVRRVQNWKTFYVIAEKARVLFNIEVTSPGTFRYDLKDKVDEYYRSGVPVYVIVNAREKKGVRTIQIIGYRVGPTRYEKMELDEQGRLLLEPVGLLLGAENERVCCYDAATGEKIGDYEAIVRAHQAVEKQAQAAEKQAQAAKKQAQAAKKQAQAAKKREQEERQARKAAEEHARQLEEELRRLRGAK